MVFNLLKCGADVKVSDRYGQTALMLTAHAGHYQVVETLIGHGANLDITAKNALALQRAPAEWMPWNYRET
jgi:ankyrin repeat protein